MQILNVFTLDSIFQPSLSFPNSPSVPFIFHKNKKKNILVNEFLFDFILTSDTILIELNLRLTEKGKSDFLNEIPRRNRWLFIYEKII